MDIETLRQICLSLPHVTEEIKWGNDLCFCLAGKMFCVADLSGSGTVSFKVTPDEFANLVNGGSVVPAPYLARYHWIQVRAMEYFSEKEWQQHIRNSYELIREKLPPKLRKMME